MKAGVLANSAPALLCWSNLVTGTLCTLMIRTRFAGRPTRRTTYIFTGIKNEYQVFISRLVLVLVKVVVKVLVKVLVAKSSPFSIIY